MKKLLRYIFIPVLAVLLMSHNVSAVDTIIDLSNYSSIKSFVRANMDCNIDGTSYTNADYCEETSNGSHQLNNIYSNSTVTLKKNDIFEFDLAVFSNPGPLINDSPQIATVNFQINGSNFRLLSFKDISNTVSVDFYSLNPSGGGITGGTFLSKVIRFTVIADNDFTGRIGFQSSNSNFPIMYFYGPMFFKYFNGVIYRKNNTNDINNEQADATQDASDNSATTADGNSSSQATSNLLGVFGSFVTSLTTISPSNCNVDFDLGHIDFGVQNLCSQPVPQAFTVVTSIIVVCFTIPFVVHLIRRILSLIREMQT